MIIKNLKNQYYVIQKLKSHKDFDILHCRILESKENTTYDVVKIKNRQLMPHLIEVFTEELDNQTFYDLFECFSKSGMFYIVFKHGEGISLEDKLMNEHCTLRERLEIGKNILERIILLAMPDFLLYEILNSNNTYIEKDLTISFSYQIKTLDYTDQLEFSKIMKKVTELMELLFHDEIERKESEDIGHFIEMCNEYNFTGFLEFYQEYIKFYDVICKQSDGGFIKPNTLLFRIWEKTKKVFHKTKKYFIAALFVILFIILVKSLFTEENKTGTDFDKIGSVKIGNIEETT